MPANSTHPEYDENLFRWNLCADVVGGEDSVKNKSELYLPRLEGQSTIEYDAYKMRASFYAATQRAVEAFTGAIFRKDPEVKVKDGRKEDMESLGCEGESLETLSCKVVDLLITAGRVGLLVDAGSDENDSYPYVAVYKAENIVNWQTVKIKGELRLSMVVLYECKLEPSPEDEFVWEDHEYYRVLELLSDDGGYYYQQRLFEEVLDKDEKSKGTDKMTLVLRNTVIPTKVGGKRLDHIPFAMITPKGISVAIEKPPIYNMACVNLSHYRTSADLEHGRHFTALPVAYAAGFNTKELGELRIGSSVAWCTEDPTATAGYLEFTGAGLGALRDAMTAKEHQMAVLGARMLEEQKKAAETREALMVRHSGEQNVLSAIANAGSTGMTYIVREYMSWVGDEDPTAFVRLNTEFDFMGIDPQLLAMLVQAEQNGSMSFNAFYFNLQKGGLYAEDWTIEKELAAIAEGGPISRPGKSMSNSTDPNADPTKKAKTAPAGARI